MKPKIVFQLILRLLPNIGKWDRFLENASWKLTHFSKNINVETNDVIVNDWCHNNIENAPRSQFILQ